MAWALLLTLPWLLLAAFFRWGVRLPRELPDASHVRPPLPSVSIVVPARNEEGRIGLCVRSLTQLDYPDFEILVVDDGSTDGTRAEAEAVPACRARGLRVLRGEPLPDGWLGKPWACHQGARTAQGEWLLFTDADTRHEPPLLARALAGAREDGVEALSLVGRQVMGSFWERVVQPQMFVLLSLRYPRAGGPHPPERKRAALAAGQYILCSRRAYRAVGGHEAVRSEVVEDVRLAQELTGAGRPLSLRSAHTDLRTRMYTSLPEVVEGWTKNLAVGSRQTLPPPLGPLAPLGIALHLLTFWILPPLVLLGSAVAALLAVPGALPPLAWGAGATGVGMGIWSAVSLRFGISPLYGVAFPLGAAAAVWIALKSGLRGRSRIVWKGREYALKHSVGRRPG